MNKEISLFAAACLMACVCAHAEVDPRFKQGAIFEKQGKYDMALGEYRSILAEDARNAEAYLAAAKVYVKKNELPRALANFRLAYKFDSTMTEAYEGAAKIYEANGESKKAAEERAKDPKNKPAPVEPPAEAAPEAEPVAAEAAPAEKTAETKPAETAKAAEETTNTPAAEPMKDFPKEPPKEPVKDVTPEPVKAAEPATPAEPALPADPFERGKALFAAGKVAEAAPLWRDVLKKTPGHAGAYFYAGLTRYELGELDKAEFNLKKGLEYKEEGNDANYYLACIYQKSGKLDLERKFLNSYLKKASPNGKFRRVAEARLSEMNALAMSSEGEEPSAASSDSKQVAKDDTARKAAPAVAEPAPTPAAGTPAAPVAEGSSIANGIMMYRSGDLDSALEIYRALLETEKNPEARSFILLQIGNVYRELRDFNSAIKRYREVVELFSETDWALEAQLAIEDANWQQKHASELPRRK